MTDPVIQALKAEQAKIAQEFFRRPPRSGNVEFDYGHALGVYAGLELAIHRIIALYQDERKDFD